MATIVLGAASAVTVGSSAATATTAATAGTPVFGPLTAALMVALGSFIDSKYVYPALQGRRKDALPPRTFDLQDVTADPGDPRILAYGGEGVRVPCHVLFAAREEVTANSGNTKTGKVFRVEVFGDLALAINDRETRGLRQLIADGKLVYFTSRNLVVMRTHTMTVAASGANLVLTASDIYADDFASYFEANDSVKLTGFSTSANNGYWKVSSIAAHTGSTPSTMTLAPRGGQTSANGNAGTATSPAQIERVDDAVVDHDYTVTSNGNPFGQLFIDRDTAGTSVDFEQVFKPGDKVTLTGYTPSGINFTYHVLGFYNGTVAGHRQMWLRVEGGTGSIAVAGPYTAGSSTSAGVVRFTTESGPVAGTLDGLEFYDGSSTQTAPSLVSGHESDVPGYRGVALVTLDELNLTNFGNRIPIFEAIIQPDLVLTFAEAVREIVRLGAMPSVDATLDLSGAGSELLRGFFQRGPQPIAQTLQPLFVAQDFLTQERGDKLAVFKAGNSDVQAVNPEDLAAHVGSDTTNKATITIDRVEDQLLPTAVGISFVDSSRTFGKGYENYGLRNPATLGHDNRMEIDLRPLSLTRPQARDIAARQLRRAWIGREVVSVALPPSYIHLLENDVLTLDEVLGRDWVLRVVQANVGADWIVRVRAVVEDLSIQVAHVGARGSAGSTPPRTNPPTVLDAYALDIPAVSTLHIQQPGLYFVACPTTSGWAGAVVYESVDNVAYSIAGTLQTPHVMGAATNVLAVGSTLTMDVTNTVNVRMSNGATLASATIDEVGIGANWFLLGDEILAFLTATLETDGSYTLSNLLRGLRDTSDHMATHAVDERFVRLTALGENAIWWPFPDGLAANGRRRYIKIVPAGALLADITAIDFTPRAETMRCFRPVNVRVTRASNAATITWDSVPRSPAAQSFSKLQLEERVEEYLVRVFTDGTFASIAHDYRITATNAAAVKRQLFLSSAEQTARGLTPGATLHMRIWQVGAAGDGNYQQVSL